MTSAVRRPPATRIALTSGKGGVGKTSLTVNLGAALARLGHRVGVLDADFALGNIDVMLGLAPERHLGAVLAGRASVADVTLDGPAGLRIIPAGSGIRSLTALDDAQWTRFETALDEAGRDLDFLLLDTASGVSDNVLDVVGLADYALVVTSYEPAAVVDAYAVVKLLTRGHREKPIGIVVNSARDDEQATLVFRQLSVAAERFLSRSIRYDGHIVEDVTVRDAARAQQALIDARTRGPAAACIRRLASRLAASRPSGSTPWPDRRDGQADTPGAPRAVSRGGAQCA